MRTRNKTSYSYDIVAAFERAWIGLRWLLSRAGRCIEPELHPGHIIAAWALWGLRAALWSRNPILVLKAGYTVASLWVRAQPVGSRVPVSRRSPSARPLPE